MIIRILRSSATFRGVGYNMSKVDRNKGELMRVANFGVLQGLGMLRPEDYRNYLKMLSAQNNHVRKPQFHAVISCKGKQVNKNELTVIAEKWLALMGYGEQPYLVVFHKDTGHNHVHMVSTRIGRDGHKISSAFENRRAIACLNSLLWGNVLSYSFSTRAQCLMLMESKGLDVKLADEEMIAKRLRAYQPDLKRRSALKAILLQCRSVAVLKEQFQIELVFHAKNGQPPYGYSILDHAGMTVWKGSEILPMKLFLAPELTESKDVFTRGSTDQGRIGSAPDAYLPPVRINIASDVDDDAVHGPTRRRKRKARTNTR